MKRALSKKNLWDATPRFLKRAFGGALRAVSPERLLGRRFRENLRFLQDAQWWPAQRAREYQLPRLRETLALAYERTDFYRDAFDSAGFHPNDLKSLEDVEQLPTIDRTTVVGNLERMCTRDVGSRDVDYVSTGGTSGRPLRFYINSGRSAVEYAYLCASWRRAGYELGTPMAVLRGRIVAPRRGGLYHEYDPILRLHYYSNFHMTDDNMRRYLEHISAIGPCFLHAYPSSAGALARFVRRAGLRPPANVRGVLLESENIYRDEERLIEGAFGCRAFASYGHSEKLVLAAQCEHSKDYHVWPTYGFFELLDERGRRVTTVGEEGEIVGTGFINTVVPFIRYRTGDYATYAGDRCDACGRQHVVLRNIKGRWPQGGLRSLDGSVVSMTALNVHDDTFENVREYQFHQSAAGRATLRIVPARQLDPDEKRRIVESINRRLQGQVTVDLEIRGELKRTGRGKLPRVIQEPALASSCSDGPDSSGA